MDDDLKSSDEAIETPADASRRTFIKGVIGSGAAAFSASYLFRTSPVVPGLLAQAGVSERLLTLNVNGQQRRVDVTVMVRGEDDRPLEPVEAIEAAPLGLGDERDHRTQHSLQHEEAGVPRG